MKYIVASHRGWNLNLICKHANSLEHFEWAKVSMHELLTAFKSKLHVLGVKQNKVTTKSHCIVGACLLAWS